MSVTGFLLFVLMVVVGLEGQVVSDGRVFILLMLRAGIVVVAGLVTFFLQHKSSFLGF